jgi:hypothetical protein
MVAELRFRDAIKLVLPWWLSDRIEEGKTAGYRYIWSVVSTLDELTEGLIQGVQSPWPGKGTPTALPYIGRSRGILRGQADTDDEYATKLRGWLDRWLAAGSQLAIAREIHEYLSDHPRVRVINRAGHWVTMNEDGTVETADATWDWDSVSNPERAGNWSEIWVVVYTSQFPNAGTWGDGRKWGLRDSGLGHVVKRVDRDAMHNLIGTWKAAHSLVRTIIWTTDNALFDPTAPLTLPNGNWGQWSKLMSGGSRVASDRNTSTCRFWELENG